MFYAFIVRQKRLSKSACRPKLHLDLTKAHRLLLPTASASTKDTWHVLSYRLLHVGAHYPLHVADAKLLDCGKPAFAFWEGVV